MGVPRSGSGNLIEVFSMSGNRKFKKRTEDLPEDLL
jgi:hypothetical protein